MLNKRNNKNFYIKITIYKKTAKCYYTKYKCWKKQHLYYKIKLYI